VKIADPEIPTNKYRAEAEKKLGGPTRLGPDNNQQIEHELKVHQVELEMQNQELRDAQELLRASLDRISCLYHQSPVGFVTIDSKGQVQDCNESFLAMLGRSAETVRLRYLAEFCSSDSAKALRLRLPAIFNQPIGKVIHLTLLCKNGKDLQIELEGRHLPDVEHLACTVIDRTAHIDAEAKYRLLFENMTAGFALYQKIEDYHGKPQDFRYLEVNPAFERLTGLTAEACVGRGIKDLLPVTAQSWVELFNRVSSTGKPATDQIFTRETGKHFDVFAFSPRHNQFAAILLDITERAQIEEALREKTIELERTNLELEQLATVFSHVREGVIITDPDGTIIDVNSAFCQISGYARDEIIGQNPRLLKSGVHSPEFYSQMWQSLLSDGHWSGEIWNRHKNGSQLAVLLTISAVRGNSGATRHYVAVHADISAQKEHQQQLEFIAHYDTLTGLPNRKLFDDRLHQALAQSTRHQQPLAVVYIDLDGFKAINDHHGHDAGDHLLKTIGAHMKACLRESDTLARFGGDEFVAVLADLTDIHTSTPYIKRLLAAAARPVSYQGQQLQVSSSIGVAFYSPTDTIVADQLLRQADQAMYQAKLAGKNRYHIFDLAHDLALRDHNDTLAGIHRAIKNNEFVLFYQPKVNMRSGEVIGMEALIRWQHPDRGILAPEIFLPEVEKHPLDMAIGEWVLTTALNQIATWQSQGLALPVSVNVTAHHLQRADFTERLQRLLAAHPDRITGSLSLEVQLTCQPDEIPRLSAAIAACKEMGINVALDNFGTGCSSLNYLCQLSAETFKVHRCFVHDMVNDGEDLAMLKGLLALASAYQRQPIAAGVETVAQGEVLLDLFCDLAQGFAIAEPMTATAVPAWLSNWKPDRSWYQRPLK